MLRERRHEEVEVIERGDVKHDCFDLGGVLGFGFLIAFGRVFLCMYQD